uniref:MFS domain-containing protein n=1 Tax=Bursaphelenchus xylophilus TaxID=6326 RepID=A0A1I7S9V9_BURXY
MDHPVCVKPSKTDISAEEKEKVKVQNSNQLDLEEKKAPQFFEYDNDDLSDSETEKISVAPEESRIVEETPWRSIVITAMLGFCQAMQMTLYYSSTWPYLLVVDNKSTETFYGLVIAVYSIGQLVGAPLFGYWSTKARSVKGPLAACLILSMFGNFLYTVPELIPQNARFVVLAARFIMGLGSGNMSVLKSYVAMASTQQDRGRAFTFLTAGLSLGQTTGPVIQLLLSLIGRPGYEIFGTLRLDMYTAASYSAKSKRDKNVDQKKLPPFDMLAVFVCYCTVCAQRFTFVNLSALNSPMGMTIFGFTKIEVVRVLGITHTATTGVALTLYVCIMVFKLDRFMNLRRQIVCAFIGLLVFHMITFAWPFLPSGLNKYTQEEYDLAEANGTELTGCNTDRFDWCDRTPVINPYLYYIAWIIFVGFCQPNINVTLNTLFSKILGPRRIGTQQGILQMSGCTARLAGPILASQLYTAFGPQVPWLMTMTALGAVITTWFVFYGRMVPLNVMAPLNSVESRSRSNKEGLGGPPCFQNVNLPKKSCDENVDPISSDDDEISDSEGEKKSINSNGATVVDETPWRSIVITSMLGFCQAAQFTLYFSSTWPYLQVVDSESTETFYGAVIAAYSVGQFIASPLFGYWSSRSGSVRGPMTTCLALSIFGNFFYVTAELIPKNARFVVLAARFITGLGSGNVSVLKSYAAMASTQQDRGRAFAFLTAGLSLGQTTGPAIQLLLSLIGYPGYKLLFGMQLDMYTAAAYSAVGMNLLGLFLLIYFFVEKYAGIDKSVLENTSKGEKSGNNQLPPYDMIAVFVCYCTMFAHRFTFVNLEALNSPMGMTVFSFTRLEVVRILGLTHSATTFIALALYVCIVVFKLDRYMNLRRQIVCAFVGLVVFHLITFSWPFYPTGLDKYSQKEYNLAEANGTELTGCNTDRFNWCDKTPILNPYLYYITWVLFVGFCQPNVNLTLNTLFSKILGPRRIGTQQGILQMSGCASRLIGPILASQLYTMYGPQVPWIMDITVLAAVVAMWAVFYDRMVPLEIRKDDEKEENNLKTD